MSEQTGPEAVDVASTSDDAVALVLARAFADDPFMMWMMLDDRRRRVGAQRIFKWEVDEARTNGRAVMTQDGSAAALWFAPKRWRTTGMAAVHGARALLGAVGTSRFPTVVRGLREVERAHPKEAHWYLATVGSDPDRRGHGAGAAVINSVLELCDHEGHPAYLESSKEINVPYYERFGFTVTGEIDVPTGPRLWSMWRDPR